MTESTISSDIVAPAQSGVWMYGCMGVCVYVCMGVWVYGVCMSVCVLLPPRKRIRTKTNTRGRERDRERERERARQVEREKKGRRVQPF
jgi:hypothetical protein